MVVAQVAHEILVEAVAAESVPFGQGLGGVVQRREMVAVALHPVAHLLVDRVGRERRRGSPVGGADPLAPNPLRLRAEGPVERQEALGHGRHRPDRRVRLG